MYRDRPIDPVDNVLYWTEYVLRYDTSLMRPLGINYTWWQRRLLDVYAVITLGLIAIFSTLSILIYYMIKWALKLCFGKVKTE